VLFREIEISHAFGIATQPRAIGFIRGKALEGDQGEGDIVGALCGMKADEVAATARDDGEPALGIPTSSAEAIR
jgi:hypothetical protein